MDISIAVATPKGLVVPVLRNVETMNYSDIEKTTADLGQKVKPTLPVVVIQDVSQQQECKTQDIPCFAFNFTNISVIHLPMFCIHFQLWFPVVRPEMGLWPLRRWMEEHSPSPMEESLGRCLAPPSSTPRSQPSSACTPLLTDRWLCRERSPISPPLSCLLSLPSLSSGGDQTHDVRGSYL